MTKFNRDNLDNKKTYYIILIIVELVVIFSLFYFTIHWLLLLFITPILLIDIISNKRCLNRQKNFISKIEFLNDEIICTHLKNNKTIIPFNKTRFSIRQEKFEKDKTEIEIKRIKTLKSVLIGRLHIKNWSNIFELKNEFLTNSITQIKYRPEGFWSKYGVLTADVVITGAVIAGAELAECSGCLNSSSSFGDVFMPISEIKEAFDPNSESEKNPTANKM